SKNWNESRMPVSRRSVSGEGTSMWKLSTNSVPRRSMMAFASVKFASFLVSYVRRARLAIHPADVRGRRRFHPRLHRARFDAAEALPQPGTVDLAIVILGQGVIAYPAGREHVRGQHFGQALAQALHGDADVRCRDVGAADQPSFETFGLDGHYRTLPQARERVERRLDLAQLDAVAPALDLRVGAAYVMEQAVVPAAREVAGLVDAVVRARSIAP